MFVFKRKNLIILGVFVLVIIAFSVCLSALVKVPAASDDTRLTVVIDAGHGGIDYGVSGIKTGVKESELNLKISRKLGNYFNTAKIKVVYTRNSDAGLYGLATKNRKKKDMQKRKEIILKAKPNAVISVHMNYYTLPSRRGAQVFYKSSSNGGQLLAQAIQKSFNLMEEASRSCSVLSGDYYILNCSDYPSVIAECGFLSNSQDEELLVSEDYQDKLAYTIFKGVISYLAEQSVYKPVN